MNTSGATRIVSGAPAGTNSALPRGGRAQLANLAFGSINRREDTALTTSGMDPGRHLAFVTSDALDLDLSDETQRRFGDYELLELVGEGGMGVVYRARQISLDREVAVKLLSAGPWASRDFVERFQREAQNAARMQHPNIVPIHEVGTIEGLHFFSMRLIRGTSLAADVKRAGRLRALQSAQILRVVAEAVDYAHRLGVLHLDLKPANVLMDENGEPHVADFGLARRLDQHHAADNTEVSGTPSYMAPEQATARAQKITPKTDIWGLGAVLYELVTGVPPFLADSAQSTLQLVVEGNLRNPREIAADLPRDLEAIILKCMARESSERYASARDLADDLGRFIDNRPVRARPLNRAQRTWRWARRQPYVAAFALLFAVSLLAGIIGVSTQWRRAERSVDLAQRTLWDLRDAASQRQIIDGEAYRALDGALANVREMESHGAAPERAALERLRIGTVLANAPRLIDAIALGKDIDQFEFAPNGKAVAALTGSVIHLIDVQTGEERWSVDATKFSSSATPGRKGPSVFLRISRDGTRMIANHPTNPDPELSWETGILIDVASGQGVEPPRDFTDLLACIYSSDARFALLVDKQQRMQLWQVSPWAPSGDLVKVRNGPRAEGDSSSLDDVLVSDDGKVIIGSYDRLHILRTLDPQSLSPKLTLNLTKEQGRLARWMLSHDGRSLAVSTMNGKLLIWNTGDGQVRWLQSAAVGPAGEIPFQNAVVTRLQFSDDDRRLLAVSYHPNDLRVFDTRTGELVTAPISLGEITPNMANFGNGGRSIWLRSSLANVRIWDLPETNAWQLPPTLAAPSFPGEQTRFAMSADPMSRMMAMADNGMAKLFRSPAPPMGDRMSAPLVTETLRVPNDLLVGVAGNRVEVFHATTQAAKGVSIQLSQPPTFADLTPDGETLVAIAGRALSAWDWRTGAPRWPEFILENSPAHVSVAANAPVIAVSTGHSGADDAVEIIQVIDLRSGKARGAPIPFHWLQRPPRLSPDGRFLITAVDSDAPELKPSVLLVIDTLDPDHPLTLSPPAKDGAPINDARFADDGSIWATTSGSEDVLWHWNAKGEVLLSKRLPNLRNHFSGVLLPLSEGRGVIVLAAAAHNTPLLVLADGTARALPGPAAQDILNVAELSADGKLLALATRNSVLLVDVANGQRLLPELKLALAPNDSVRQLAFSSAEALVGRTIFGHWFHWQVRADLRPVAEIERDLQLRHFERTVDPAAPLSSEERSRLRADDPGPAQVANGAVEITPAAIPAPMSADLRYVALDLSPIANVDTRLVTKGWPPGLPTLPRGPQRYEGVDFHLGSGVQLAGGSQNNNFVSAFALQSKVLSVEPQAVSAIYVLAFQFDSAAGEVAHVDLHYADGGERALPILEGRDLISQADVPDEPSMAARRHIGWQGIWAENFNTTAGFNSGEATVFWSYVVHLENPEPQRPVSGISFGAKPESPGLLVLALTLERADAARTAQ